LPGDHTYYNNNPSSSSIPPSSSTQPLHRRSARRNATLLGQATNLSGDISTPEEEDVNFTEEDVHSGSPFSGSPFSVPLDDLTANLNPTHMSNSNLGQVVQLTQSNMSSLTGCTAPPCFSPDEVNMAKLHQAAERAGAPKYLVDCFMSILTERMSSNNFQPMQPFLPSRKSLLIRAQ
jgi:hypothetical protein